MSSAQRTNVLKAVILCGLTLLGVAGGWAVALAIGGVLHPDAADAATATDTATDPFTYCARAGTIDAPDPSATDGQIHPAITTALVAHGMAAESVRWRCFEGSLYACGVAANVPCGRADQRTRGSQDVRRYCQQQPNAPSVPAGVAGHRTLYHWRCERGEPAIVQQVAHADERGFVAEYWQRVERP